MSATVLQAACGELCCILQIITWFDTMYEQSYEQMQYDSNSDMSRGYR